MSKRAGYGTFTPPNKLKPIVRKGSVFDRLHKGSTAARLNITTTQASHSRETSDGDVVRRLGRRFDDCWGVIGAGAQDHRPSDLDTEPGSRKVVELVADARPKTSTYLARSAISSRLMRKHRNSVDKIDLDDIEEERPKAQKNRPLVLSYSQRLTKKTAFSKVVHFDSPDHSTVMSAPLTPVYERSKKSVALETPPVTVRLMRRTLNPGDQRPHFRVNLKTRSLSVLERSERGQEKVTAMRELLATTYTTEVEEPPDLLDLNFMDRGRYWEHSKYSRLAEKAEEITQAVLKECTFKPKVSLLSRMPTPTKAQSSKPLSYTVQHRNKMSSKTAPASPKTSRREKDLSLQKAGQLPQRETKISLTITTKRSCV
jgi:hypothetical protein